MRRRLGVLFLFSVFFSVFAGEYARADVVASGPAAFTTRYEATVAASPDRAFRALGALPRWWDSAHTYSGDAARHMRFDLRAGGCLCEQWGANSVEHARVILVLHNEGGHTVRLSGALGPLQEMGVTGILTFFINPDPAGAKIVMTYRVSGEPGLNLPELAPAVDHVLTEQFGRFIRYTAGQALP